MGPPQGRAEGEENLPDLLPTLLLMHPRIPSAFLAPRARCWLTVTLSLAAGRCSMSRPPSPGPCRPSAGRCCSLGGPQGAKGAGSPLTVSRPGWEVTLALVLLPQLSFATFPLPHANVFQEKRGITSRRQPPFRHFCAACKLLHEGEKFPIFFSPPF